MVEADHAADLPCSIFVLPELDEFGFAYIALVIGMMEAMDAYLYRAVAGDGIDLKRSGDKFAGHFAADIVLNGINQSLPPNGQAGFVVIELDVIGNER